MPLKAELAIRNCCACDLIVVYCPGVKVFAFSDDQFDKDQMERLIKAREARHHCAEKLHPSMATIAFFGMLQVRHTPSPSTEKAVTVSTTVWSINI